MSVAAGRGSGMRLDSSRVRFARTGAGREAGIGLNDSVVEVRRLLRTDMTVAEIAESLGVQVQALKAFIKRRQLCRSLADRQNFISLQRSIAKLDRPSRQHSSDVEQPLCRRTRADSSPAAGTISEVSQ